MSSPHNSHRDPQNKRPSSSSASRPPQSSWASSGPVPPQAGSRRGLAPISTNFNPNSTARPSSSSSPRNLWSPDNTQFSTALPGPSSSATLRQPQRSSSISAASSPYTPPTNQLASSSTAILSGRARGATSAGNQSHPSSTSITSQGTASPGNAGLLASTATTSNALGSAKPSRASPALFHSSLNSPSTASPAQERPLNTLIITQVILLLSSIKDEDKSKNQSQADQIRKLVDSHGMEVFAKYFRRLLATNATQIWSPARGAGEPHPTYPILVEEVKKISSDPLQAVRIVESVDFSDGDRDNYKDFDLSTFMDHFKMDSLAKVTLASAFKRSSRSDLRTKADAIMSKNLDSFLRIVANPGSDVFVDPSPSLLATIVDRLSQAPPRNWNHENHQSLLQAVQHRYNGRGTLTPVEVNASLLLFEFITPDNPLVKLVHKSGPQALQNNERCKALLESADEQDINYEQVANTLLFMVISREEPLYNPAAFTSAVCELLKAQQFDWHDVLRSFDREGVRITKEQFKRLFDALIPLSYEYNDFDIQRLWGGDWRHSETQLMFATAFLSCSQFELDVSQIPRIRTAFSIEDFSDASEQIRTHAEMAVRHPLVSLDAVKALFYMVFRSSDTYAHAQSLGVIENVINSKMDLFVAAVSAVPKPWGALQDQAMKQLVGPFLSKSMDTHSFVFHILWKRDSQWLASRLVQFYQQTSLNLPIILEHAQEHGVLNDLIGVNSELSIDLAAVAHGRSVFDLDAWLQQLTLAMPSARVLIALSQFLKSRAEDEIQAHREGSELSTVPLAIKTVHVLLTFIGDVGLSDEEQVPLLRACIQAYPRLINYGQGFDTIIDLNGQNGNGIPTEADKKMQEHYKQMYSGESQVRDIITVLQKYKTSQDPAEQDLFACMIFGLFDEYNCFAEYPMDALATTAVLFGGIINYSLLSRNALRAALAMVLEAVREYPPDEPMYKFGLQALLHFQDQLPRWKKFCERLLLVSGLRGTQIESVAQRIVRSEEDMVDAELQDPNLNEGNVDGFLRDSTSKPTSEFTCIAVDAPLRPKLQEEPDDDIKEAVLFILNNITERNIDTKFRDLDAKLEARHYQWFSNYLVEQRIKTQSNFQPLYRDLLDRFEDDHLWGEVLRETYVSCFQMLNSESTISSSSERSLLKNLGSWLGSITLARDSPIKFRNISFKDLIIEAHDSQRLLVVLPFICNVLEGASQSLLFKPPCAWTMEVVRVLLEVYHIEGLKVQLKFDIQRVCTALGVDEKKIEPADSIRSRPPQNEVILSAPIPEGMEGFGDLAIMNYHRRALAERFSPFEVVPELANISPMLKHNYSLPPASPVGHSRLKQILVQSVERALSDIIGPVVERSVTIAAIATSQLIAKDFAMEPDAERYKAAAHTSVKHLAGNLALVTCKEPLRTGIQHNIRTLARDDNPDAALPEGVILMFVNDNLDTVCGLVERAAEGASLGEIDVHIDDAIKSRKAGAYTEPQVNRWAYHIPDPFKPEHGGLNQEQMAIYEDFGRSARNQIGHTSDASQDGTRQIPDVVADQYASMQGVAHPEPSSFMRQAPNQPSAPLMTPQDRPAQPMLNGYSDTQPLGDRIPFLVSELVKAAAEGSDDGPHQRLADSRAVDDAWDRLNALIYSPNQAVPPETIALHAGEQVCLALYQEQLPQSAAAVLARVLELLCKTSEQTTRDIYSMVRTHEILSNPAATVALLKHRILDCRRIDLTVAKAIDNRESRSLEFLNGLVDGLLVCDPPIAFRADFAHSISALANWHSQEPNLPSAKDIALKLHEESQPARSISVGQRFSNNDPQVKYIFDEWAQLQKNEAPKASLETFIRQLCLKSVISTPDGSAQFFRTCIDASVDAFDVAHSAPVAAFSLDVAYLKVDALAKMILLLVAHQGQQNGGVISPKPRYFANILSTVVLVLAQHYHQRGDQFCQKAFFRLLAGILCEINAGTTSLSSYDRHSMAVTMGHCLQMLRPQNFPGFSFAWLALVSHRMFMPAMLKSSDSSAVQTYTELLCDHLSYLGELLKPLEVSRASKDLYRGTLEVLLVLHHDFPEFVVENHFQLLDNIPLHCVQMRSLIISASAGFRDLPDPFTSGLKVDRLEEMRRSPLIRINVEKILQEANILSATEDVLAAPSGNLSKLAPVIDAARAPAKPKTGIGFVPIGADDTLLNALVIYLVKTVEVSSATRVPTFWSDSPQCRVLDYLVENLPPEARYYFISAIVNQLRYPNSHTAYFSDAVRHLFRAGQTDDLSSEIQLQIVRVLLERLLVHRPHPWGLIVTLLEFLKNQQYRFWELPFVKAAPDLERMFGMLFQQMNQNSRALV